MTWILILLQLAPYLIKIILAIMEAIDKKPFLQRRSARAKVFELAKTHAHRLRIRNVALASTQDDDIVRDWESLKTSIGV